MELSKNEHDAMSKTIITISGMSFRSNGILQYSFIKYSSNVGLEGKFKSILPKSLTTHHRFDISRVSEQYVLICATKIEFLAHYQNFKVINEYFSKDVNDTSSMVILYMVSLNIIINKKRVL